MKLILSRGVKGILMTLLIVFLVDLYWLPKYQGHWYHELGLIGYFLIGWYVQTAFQSYKIKVNVTGEKI